MNRYSNYGRLDEPGEILGDAMFNRLDMQSDPSTLPPGSLQVSENLRFDTNGTQVRAGIARQFPAGTNVGRIYLAAIYKRDDGEDQFALVTGNALVLFSPSDQSLTTYNFPPTETVGAGDDLDAVQAGVGSGTLPDLYILRGFTKTVLKFNPTDGVTVDSNFRKGDTALFYQDRIAVISDLQDVSVSDFLDFGTWSVLNQFQILKGGDDYLVSMNPYQKDYVLIGARKRFFIAFFDPHTTTTGYDGSLVPETSFLRELTREAGPVGKRAVLEAAGLVWFITGDAIYAFQPQLDNELTVLGKPISADIQPIIKRLSFKYASGAAIERLGYRLYFALPISDVPVKVTDITVVTVVTNGVQLPFTLPANLSSGGVATVTTATPHGLQPDDRVQMVGAVERLLNGEVRVLSVDDSTHFTYATNAPAGSIVGNRVTAQKLATRNNTIAVFNLNNRTQESPLGAWESIDSLPANFYADYLRTAEYGAQRRLWVVDATAGPALYEEGSADEIGDINGGIALTFTLPAALSEANFATAPIPGRAVSRSFRWGAYPRKVRAGEARLRLGDDSAGTFTVRVRTPRQTTTSTSRTFLYDDITDMPVRKRIGQRGLEAEIEISTSGGRPTIRALEVETAAVGKVED